MIFVLAELIVIAIVLGGIIVQVAVPLWNDTPLFPVFRRKKARIEAELAEARENVEVAQAESLLKSLKAKAVSYKTTKEKQ